ncbi:hypothetical protein CF327_g4066 [Tilletia walkeri]|nr:hypothetical protein CF327_g4066 [Tilletia walkeri]
MVWTLDTSMPSSSSRRRSTRVPAPSSTPATAPPTPSASKEEAGEDTQVAGVEVDVDDAEDADEEGAEADDADDDVVPAAAVRTVNIDGVPFVQKGDSLVLPNDEAGDTKVDDKGRLQGGRVYKFPVFQMPNRADPEKLYVLSIDAARSAGYRDSLYFYRNNKRLFKLTLNMAEKEMLIARGRLSMQLRTRNVTATSVLNVFKTHGARVIKAGRAVTDDYYESAARASGRREGERVRAEGGRERGAGDGEFFNGGAGGPGGVDYDASGLAFATSGTLASIRNKRVDSNVHSFPDPVTGQPLLTIFGDAGLSPWVRIEEGPRAGQTMRKKMLSNLDIDQDNWMREAAYMVIGMNRELEDGRKERMRRILPGGGMRSLLEEAIERKRKRLEAEEEGGDEEDRKSFALPNGATVNGNGPVPGSSSDGYGLSSVPGVDVDGGNSGFIATAVLHQGSTSSTAVGSHLGPIGVYEPLTGLIHVPSTTQPTQARWARVGDVAHLPPSQGVANGGKLSGGYLSGTKVGSGAWAIASVSTEMETDGKLEGEGVGYRIVKAGASEEDVGGEGL